MSFRVRRLPEREIGDRGSLLAILDEGIVCHAAYVDGGRPVVIPTLYVRDHDRLLLHGSNSMGLARAVRGGSPISAAVTLLDGLVVARSGFHSSANYRSVVVHGTGSLLSGEARSQALRTVVERLIPGRSADLRPSTAAEEGQTAVIALGLDTMTGKRREGGPKDDPGDLGSGVWAGVIPIEMVAGPPAPADDLEPSLDMPEYLARWPATRSPEGRA